MADTADSKCKKCSRDITEASQCERCDVKYCSRSCQNLHWKTHKKSCARNREDNRPPPRYRPAPGASPSASSSMQSNARGPTRPTPPRGLEEPIMAAFTKLDRGTYLHDRPEQDVYKLLIDTYRLRMEDNQKIDRIVEPDSIYASRDNDGVAGFRRFLDKAKTKARFLPPWWSEEKQTACEELAAAEGWSNLRTKISKADVIQHYGDDHFSMQLRMLGEAVWGRSPGGADGTPMRKMMASRESGTGPAFMDVLHMDTASGNVYQSAF